MFFQQIIYDVIFKNKSALGNLNKLKSDNMHVFVKDLEYDSMCRQIMGLRWGAGYCSCG